jgi:uncharacterized membrane protein YphA (DoxX/SURF4 family)
MSRIHDVIAESNTAFTSASRTVLGLFLIGLAVATFFVPDIKVAFVHQLDAAGIPLRRFASFLLPTVEGVAGVMLLGGVLVRVASLVSVLLMAVLVYIDLVGAESTLFPLQFGLPLIPIIALVLSLFLYFVDRYEEEL